MDERMSLAAKLKKLRIAQGKSLQHLADEVGSSKAHIWDLETGRSKNPSMEMLTKLAKSLKVSVSDLVGENPAGEGEDPHLVAMYRELKELSAEDRDFVQSIIDRFKKRSQDT
jgi:transcriptional regulator with XRE-family HTH domain